MRREGRKKEIKESWEFTERVVSKTGRCNPTGVGLNPIKMLSALAVPLLLALTLSPYYNINTGSGLGCALDLCTYDSPPFKKKPYYRDRYTLKQQDIKGLKISDVTAETWLNSVYASSL